MASTTNSFITALEEIRDQGAAISWLADIGFLIVSSHGREQYVRSSVSSFFKGTNPIPKSPPSWSNYLPNTLPTPNPITLSIDFNICMGGGHTNFQPIAHAFAHVSSTGSPLFFKKSTIIHFLFLCHLIYFRDVLLFGYGASSSKISSSKHLGWIFLY